MRKREALYGEFIEECSKLLIDSLMHALNKPETMLSPYALLNRIRLSASDAVWPQFVALALIGIVMFVISLRRFRRTVGSMV